MSYLTPVRTSRPEYIALPTNIKFNDLSFLSFVKFQNEVDLRHLLVVTPCTDCPAIYSTKSLRGYVRLYVHGI